VSLLDQSDYYLRGEGNAALPGGLLWDSYSHRPTTVSEIRGLEGPPHRP
jgi:hypothetical protein